MILEEIVLEQIVETELDKLIAQRDTYPEGTIHFRVYSDMIEYLTHFQEGT